MECLNIMSNKCLIKRRWCACKHSDVIENIHSLRAVKELSETAEQGNSGSAEVLTDHLE